MADGITIDFDSKEVETLLNIFLQRVKNAEKLMKMLKRYVRALTINMIQSKFARPDNKPVRGVTWPKISKSTRVKKLKKIQPLRPLVATGAFRRSIRVLSSTANGFIFGTRKKSSKGFPYPAAHNSGTTKMPQRKWLFLTRNELRQMVKMTIDHIKGQLKTSKSYKARY